MLLLSSVLLAFVAAVNSKAITWTQQLPKDYVLINKDQLSIPIDEYVSLSSAIFTTTDPTKNIIVPKIEALQTSPSTQASNMQSCNLADNSRDTFAIYVCNQHFVRIEKDSSFMSGKDNSNHLDLLTAGSPPTIPALDPKSTTCTDMFWDNGSYMVNCYDKGNLANPNYVFKVSESLSPTLTVGTCDTGSMKGDSKMVRLITSVPNKYPILFYDVATVSNANPGTISMTYCNLDLSQPIAKSPSTNYNLITLINNQSLNAGVLRYISPLVNGVMMAFIAVDDGQNKSLYFVPLSVSDAGEIKLHTLYKISQWNATGIDGFNPRYMTFYGRADFYVASDKSNLYVFKLDPTNWTLMTAGPNNMVLPWNVPVDCGMSAAANMYISKIDMMGGNLDLSNPASRTLMVYSSIDDKKVKEFAIHINNTKYGCSRATTATNNAVFATVNTVSFASDTSLFVTADEKITKARVNYNTMLLISVGEETADKTTDISVKMEGWSSPSSQQFAYKSLKNAQDFNNITAVGKTFKTYMGSSSYLNLPSFSFRGNNPTITSSNSNVQVRYSATPTVSLTGLNIADYNIHRIFAVDEDTFAAVLRKPSAPEAFVRFWNKWNGTANAVDVQGSSIITLADKQILFKMFKLGPNFFCAIFKSNGPKAPKLTLSCYEDKKEAPVRSDANNKVITDLFEVSDIQILETETRVDMIMVGTDSSIKENTILHFYVNIDGSGNIFVPDTSYMKKIDISSKALIDYYPTDIIFDVYGDSEGTSYATIKLISKYSLQPALAKYNISFSSSGVPPTLTYLYHMYLPSSDVAFCAIKNEIIFFSPKRRQIMVNKMVNVPNGVTLAQNKLFLPISDYGIVYIQQFNCIPEKGIFQVLAVNANKLKFVINFRGGDSTSGARRVHSVVPVADTVTFIETAFTSDFIVTVASSPGGVDSLRNFIYSYTDGPKLIVDNTNMKDSYDVSITSTSATSATSQTTVRVEIVQPKLKTDIKPKNKFEVVKGKTIYLDQEANIDGPVMDIKVEGTDASKIKLIKRNNKYKGYTGGNDATTADRVFAEEDFMVLVYTGSYFKIMGDPALTKSGTAVSPPEVLTKNVNVKDAAIIKYGTQDKIAILLTRTYEGDSFKYNLYYLQRTTNQDNTYKYSYMESSALYQTTMDYDSMQLTTIGNGDVVMALKMKRSFNSNYIRLVSFKPMNNGAFALRTSTIISVSPSKDIGGHSLSWDGSSNMIYLVAFYKDYENLVLAKWDGMSSQPAFTDSSRQYKMSDTFSTGLQLDYIRCWPGAVAATLDCVVDAAGVVDYLITITPETSTDVTMDPIKTLVKVADFEMPPLFEIKRTDRGKDHYGFLLQKSAINNATTPAAKRLLQQQQSMALDSFADCNNIIVFFKPSVSRYIFTGITCSEWGNNTKIDFNMENETNDYVFLTKWPTATPVPKRVLQAATDRVGANFLSTIQATVSDTVDPNQVKFSFVGLTGPNDPATQAAVTLNDFQQGQPPAPPAPASGSSFWTWAIIILVILLLIGGGIYGYMWYQNNQAGSSTTQGSYSKDMDSSTSKNDLEDTRL